MDFKIPIHLYMLLLLLLPISHVISQNNTTTSNVIPVGTSQLTASINEKDTSFWLSPSEEFAFGFRNLDQNNNLFLLSIWFNKIPDKTIIWYANGDKPAPKGSKLILISSKGLVLIDPKGTELWKSDPITGVVSQGFMDNTGNFVLKDGDSKELWASFKSPRDTLLPSQIMERGGIVSSRFSENNFSQGRFQLRFLNDGNLVLNSINLPTTFPNEAYYISGTAGDSNTGRQLVFNRSGHFYILRENGDKVELTKDTRTDSSENFYFRATLNFDGVFILYKHPKNSIGNQSWTSVWSQPENICLNNMEDKSSGVCGYNKICTINAERRPICACPRGFTWIRSSDPLGNCKPDLDQNCEEDELNPNLYTFEVLENTNWPTSDYAVLDYYTEDHCKASCLEDCMCSVAIFNSIGQCWKKKLPLSNGRAANNLDAKAFVKVRRDNFSKKCSNNQTLITQKDQDSLILLGSVLLGSSVFVNFILIGALCFGFFFFYQRKLKSTQVHENSSVLETSLRNFTYKELVEATSGFNEELGRGAFGTVYKGKIQQQASELYVAVKKLNSSVQEMDGDKEFKTEVNVIGQTHHKNLVRLLGFCTEGTNRLLVYEFLSNGSLASFLFGDFKPIWNQRIHIAFEIARGLLYLHEECSNQIIHCDIKPQNILLDEYYNARISDFGLAKLLMMDQSYALTNIRGTKGYVAPEWFRNMPITPKVDVYSFGVMLLEIICCRKSIDVENSFEEKKVLTDWAYDCFIENKLDALIDYERDVLEDITMLERLVMVAIWCIQENPSVRPTMKKVTQMLEGVVHVPIPPSQFPSFIRN